ncbi:MAG: glycosyltransferase family 4 protein, partial [Firmicutes bacterium]|nr:glycosyltransferase family 4 protein [Bacillota bacterium]
MKVLFLTLHDFSDIKEQNIYTDLVREFAHEKHDVYIISPVEKKKKIKTRLIETDGVHILKLKIGNVQKTNIIEKGISTLSLESRFKKAIKRYFSNIKFDLVLYSTPPITLQSAIEYVSKRDSAKTYLLLKDIFPQNALDLGLLKTRGLKGLIYQYFKMKEQKLYEVSDFIGCMSEANVNFLKRNNEHLKSIIEVCPNTITPVEYIESLALNRSIRVKYEIPLNHTVFIYGGNLGKPQGIDFLLKCIESNEMRTNTYFLIVGTGTEYHRIKSFFDAHKPQNSKLIDFIPKDEYEKLVKACNVGLIFLDPRFTIPNFPSRLLSYMQSGMPVIAAT